MPMQTRGVQLIVARDLRRRLPGGEAAVDFRPLEMLACATGSAIPTIKAHDLLWLISGEITLQSGVVPTQGYEVFPENSVILGPPLPLIRRPRQFAIPLRWEPRKNGA